MNKVAVLVRKGLRTAVLSVRITLRWAETPFGGVLARSTRAAHFQDIDGVQYESSKLAANTGFGSSDVIRLGAAAPATVDAQT